MTVEQTLLLPLLVLALGCGDDPPPPPRGAAGSAVAPTQPEVPTGPAKRRAAWTPSPPRDSPALSDSAPSAVEGASGPTEQAVERDLSAELASLAGDPTSCGDLGEPTAPITIRLTATVTSLGIITRSSASGAPSQVLECLRRRLRTARLRAPIPKAPRTIEAELRLEPVSATATATDTVGPAPVWVVEGATYGTRGTPISGPSGMAIRGPAGRPIGSGAPR